MATAEATMKSGEIIEMFKRYVVPNYRRFGVALARGEGSYVWDAEASRVIVAGPPLTVTVWSLPALLLG